MKKILTLAFICLFLASCSKAILVGDELAPKATEQQQEEVKKEVLKLLEEEYNQPFKIVDYKYDYGVHWEDNTCRLAVCPKVFYGTYIFEVQSIDNPIISPKFKIVDRKGLQKELQDFKDYWVKIQYCGAFGNYWKEHKHDKNNNPLEQAKKYCDTRGQKGQYDNALTQ